jgi:hypothetical protein
MKVTRDMFDEEGVLLIQKGKKKFMRVKLA